jgi:hypothetical protein
MRLEAENFRMLDGFEVNYNRADRQVSQRIHVHMQGTGPGRIETRFDEPYSAPLAVYDVELRYTAQGAALRFLVNQTPRGDPEIARSAENGWRTHTLRGVRIADGDVLTLTADAGLNGSVRLDYVQLNLVSAVDAAQGSKSVGTDY